MKDLNDPESFLCHHKCTEVFWCVNFYFSFIQQTPDLFTLSKLITEETLFC